MSRPIHHRYDDPIDLVWLACARGVGWRVVRSDRVFAAYDGQGTLTLSTPEHLDPDDSLGQLIFHEMCHALVAGPERRGQPDYGLENVDGRDLIQEHACHRLQAALADRYGLRDFFAVTTDHRPYWDGLPVDPLGPSDDPAVPLARSALQRALHGDWAAPLQRALRATRELALTARPHAPEGSLFRTVRDLHPSTGYPLVEGDQRCGQCAWAYPYRRGWRCRQRARETGGPGASVRAADRACLRFEPALDEAACGRCGACCREAFDRVELSARETLVKQRSALVVRDGFGWHVPRPGGRCLALDGNGGERPYRCRVYAERPRSCAQFAIGSEACLEARRKLGLSA